MMLEMASLNCCGDVHLMDAPERMIECGRVPLLKRLQRLDECLGGIRHALYFGLMSSYVFISGHEDRERGFCGGHVSADQHQLVRDVVECGPQVMDDFSSEHSKAQGQRWEGERTDDLLASLLIIAHQNGRLKAVHKRDDLEIQMLDILIGPLNLRATTIERVAHSGGIV
jgi:hypothetical protein